MKIFNEKFEGVIGSDVIRDEMYLEVTDAKILLTHIWKFSTPMLQTNLQ